MTFHSSATESAVFSRPATPAARVLCLMQHRRVVTRKDILLALGLSQPTVTRAVQALIAEGLLTESQPKICQVKRKRGRPIIPVELAHTNFAYVGIVLHPRHTYVGLFNIQGHCLGEETLPVITRRDPSSERDVYPILDSITSLLHQSETHLITGGVVASQPHSLSADFTVGLPLAFEVNFVSSDMASAIVASEIQGDIARTMRTAVLYDAAGTLSAAVSTPDSVEPVPVTSSTAQEAGIEVIEACHPRILILAGDRFLKDPRAARAVMRSWKTHHTSDTRSLRRSGDTANNTAPSGDDVEFRLIPTGKKIDQVAARAIALDQVWRNPLGLHWPDTL